MPKLEMKGEQAKAALKAKAKSIAENAKIKLAKLAEASTVANIAKAA